MKLSKKGKKNYGMGFILAKIWVYRAMRKTS